MKKTFMKLTSVLFVAVLGLWSMDAQAGCNDPLACNFLSTDVDALDCDYGYELNVTGGGFPAEITYNLLDGTGAIVISGAGVLGDVIISTDTLCLADDCYSIEMFDSFGDGWNGALATLTDLNTATVLFTSTLVDGNATDGFGPEYGFWNVGTPACVTPGCIDLGACNYNSLANEDDASCEYVTCAGCTDPTFCEYDSTATIDDGSCATTFGCTDMASCLYDSTATCGDPLDYCVVAANDECVNAIAITPGVAFNADNNFVCVDEAADETGGIWYTFTMPAGPTIVTFECTDDGSGFWDNQMLLYDSCPADGGLPTYYPGTFDAITADGGGLNGNFGLVVDCDDLNAGQTYHLMIDGWNGAAVGSCDVTVSFDELTCITGCTNPLAINYDSVNSIDDGSCIVADCAPDAPLNQTYCYTANDNYAVLYESTSLGVNTIVMSWNQGTIESATFDNLTIYDGLSTADPVLFTNAAGVTTQMGDSIFQSTGDFMLLTFTSDGSVQCDGSTTYDSWDYDVYCAGISVAGCTDSGACNYNSLANLDDGTCCFDNCIQLTVGGGGFLGEVGFDVSDWATGDPIITGGTAPFDGVLCLSDGC